MERINLRFSDKFGSHWIKIKFYRERPALKETQKSKGMRFCEAAKEAIKGPVLLDKNGISCLGAQYAFGWRSDYKKGLLNNCRGKRKVQLDVLKSMFLKMPYFKKPFKYIGLNTEGQPDLIMSYMSPEKIMSLIKVYNDRYGKNLDISLCSMMSICGGIAVRTYLNKRVNISFGCNDSRRFADMQRNNLAIGIPNRLFNSFID